jgi:aldose sugar dehydrogenase
MIVPSAESRSHDRPVSRLVVLGWHVAAALALIAVPLRFLRTGPGWSGLTAGGVSNPVIAVFGLAGAYLAAGILLVAIERRLPSGRVARVVASLLALSVPLSLFLMALLLVPGVAYSRWLLLTGSVAATVLILLPMLLRRSALIVATCILAALAIVAALAVQRARPPEPAPWTSRSLITSHGTIRVVTYDDYLKPASRGGGIQWFETGFIVGTGDGEFYRLRWPDGSDSLVVARLPITVPLNRSAFAAAMGGEVPPDWFRVADLLVRPLADSLEFTSTHHHWFADSSCSVLRVSRLVVGRTDLESGRGATDWRTLYDTRPCLPIKRQTRGWLFAGPHAGGRLADLGDGRIMVTVGDMQFDGWNADVALPQDTTADYGKTLILDATGIARRITMGHRNPQGLLVDSTGRVWTTEHGPQGGDALHRIVTGANYGWPYVTYGTEYGDVVWPLQGEGEWDRSRFRPALFAWVPSPGLSNLIAVQRGPVPEWRGDLLIATLEGRRLLRVRLESERVAYVEPIPIGHRIRDIAEAPDGRIVLFIDDGAIISLLPATDVTGPTLFAQCAGCHGTDGEAAGGIGPDLHGVFGRSIAAAPGFPYSPALRSRSGRWDAKSLNDFLADPQRFAPGTTMVIEPVADSAARAVLVEYIKTIR